MWEGIMVHCSATPDGATFSWPAIRRYHVEEKKWLDIGYHGGIELVQFDYEVVIGRKWNIVGAHCRAQGGNHKYLGFCFVGNYDKAPPPERMLKIAARRFFIPLFDLNVADKKILMHRELDSSKTCPGLKFPIDEFKSMCGLK